MDEPDVAKMRWELTALQEAFKDRRVEMDARVAELEKVVEKLKDDRAKLGGMAILLMSLGSILLWFSSVGSNIAKVIGK